MSASTAPDVDRVLTRMGRSAFGYRSFPDRVEELAEMAAVPALPIAEPSVPTDKTPTEKASTSPAAGAAAAPFVLLSEAMAGADAATSASTASRVQADDLSVARTVASDSIVEAPVQTVSGTVGRSVRMRPLQPDRSRPAMDITPATTLADMFRLVGGREDALPAPDEGPVRAVAFPFRRR